MKIVYEHEFSEEVNMDKIIASKAEMNRIAARAKTTFDVTIEIDRSTCGVIHSKTLGFDDEITPRALKSTCC